MPIQSHVTKDSNNVSSASRKLKTVPIITQHCVQYEVRCNEDLTMVGVLFRPKPSNSKIVTSFGSRSLHFESMQEQILVTCGKKLKGCGKHFQTFRHGDAISVLPPPSVSCLLSISAMLDQPCRCTLDSGRVCGKCAGFVVGNDIQELNSLFSTF